MLMLGGVIITLMGIIGEYIGRIYLSINRYPQFVVRSVTRTESEKEGEALEDRSRSLGA
jgi:undecaprenyl-phosphate 4-deoxy-4-formamido-L-arabinose transferase